jgi:hypothetical protein
MGLNIREIINEVISDIGLEMTKCITYTSDNGSNFINAAKDLHFPCIIHTLNIVMR